MFNFDMKMNRFRSKWSIFMPICQSGIFTSDVLVKIAGHETLVLFPRNQTVPRSTHAWDLDNFGRDRKLKVKVCLSMALMTLIYVLTLV